MSKFIRKSVKAAGAAPGTLVHVGERKTGTVRITVTGYDPDTLREKTNAAVEEDFPLPESGTCWINVDGLHDLELIRKLGERFRIHPLTLEDILNTGHRPKVEAFDEYLCVVFKMIDFDDSAGQLLSEQISIVAGSGYLISFQEIEGDVFDPVRERIRRGRGRIRSGGPGYLVYALIDAVVDHYFKVLEKVGERIEALEEALIGEPESDTLHTIHTLKREMIYLRKQVWPMREMVGALRRGDLPQVHESTGVFYADLYDHTIQVIDTIESFRDVLSGMLDLYLSTVSNRMNEVMQVLTIIATIFIPLTFIAGIYGMNFKFMPELEWRWGYFVVWGIMVLVTAGMFLYFRRKKWL